MTLAPSTALQAGELGSTFLELNPVRCSFYYRTLHKAAGQQVRGFRGVQRCLCADAALPVCGPS